MDVRVCFRGFLKYLKLTDSENHSCFSCIAPQ